MTHSSYTKSRDVPGSGLTGYPGEIEYGKITGYTAILNYRIPNFRVTRLWISGIKLPDIRHKDTGYSA